MGFDALQSTELTSTWTNVAFFLAFFGFGMKAGIVPLHIWLPQSHPIAPSHISALMSGVMLKVAVYGFVRFSFCLLNGINLQCGCVVLLIGVVSALFGALNALVQNDLKRLLAYSSVENIGIVFIGIGLSIIFISQDCLAFAALCLIGALYHCLNHAVFKSLLFLGAGVILQQCNERNIENMGGLIKRMPYIAWLFLIGCISISALPPLNGFISEWLILQGAFQGAVLKSEIMRVIIPVSAALLALTSAITLTCFVNLYGVVFLGQERTENMSYACDPGFGTLLAIGFLALLCILFGVLPAFIIAALNVVSGQLIGTQLPAFSNTFLLIPTTSISASYNPLFVIFGIILIFFIVYFLLNTFFGKTNLRIVKPWDCGYGGVNYRMQYTATAFVMPLRRIFSVVLSIDEKIENTNVGTNYYLNIVDIIWRYLYLPIEHFIFTLSQLFARLQGGSIRIYLSCIFITLIILLTVVSWST